MVLKGLLQSKKILYLIKLLNIIDESYRIDSIVDILLQMIDNDVLYFVTVH